MNINPEWEKLKDVPYLAPLCCIPGQYDCINVGPAPKFHMKINILVTINNADGLDAATLVFKTLRVGFPNNPVEVYLNGPTYWSAEHIKAVCTVAYSIGALVNPIPKTIHHRWIERLIDVANEPFYILDTDVVFWKEFPSGPPCDTAIWGEYVPRFRDPVSRALTVDRLHTALMYIDPERFKHVVKLRTRDVKFSETFTPLVNFIYPALIPFNSDYVFYDTMAAAYQAGLGARFTEQETECFTHLHCGTWVDQIGDRIKGLKDLHKAVYTDINAAKQLRELQQKFYNEHKP